MAAASGHDRHQTYRLRSAGFRRAAEALAPQLDALDLKARLRFAAELLDSGVLELGSMGIHALAGATQAFTGGDLPLLDQIGVRLLCWRHADHLGEHVVQPLLRRLPRPTLTLLRRWSQADSRWQRRVSAVAFTRAIGESGDYTDYALQVCANLTGDGEDTVRKAVGWALKDNVRSAPERVLAYVRELRRRGVSATITGYALRDLPAARRAEILAIRREPCRPAPPEQQRLS